ncbi:MAG: TetR/AcrR family transcriptional regulator [Anaerovorax sp.]
MIQELNARQSVMAENFLKVFSKYGLDNTSTKKLSEECGINEALFYRYFENKDDIVGKCVIKKRVEILEHIHELLNENSKLGAHAVCESLVDYAETERDAERFILQVMASHKYEQIALEINAHMEKNLREQGTLLAKKHGVTEEVGYLMVSIMNSVMMAYFINGDKKLLYDQLEILLKEDFYKA